MKSRPTSRGSTYCQFDASNRKRLLTDILPAAELPERWRLIAQPTGASHATTVYDFDDSLAGRENVRTVTGASDAQPDGNGSEMKDEPLDEDIIAHNDALR